MSTKEHKIAVLEECELLSRESYNYFFPKRRENQLCYSVWKEEDVYKISTGYFIGVDWIEKNIKHTQVHPKINFNKEGEKIREVDYLKMLFGCLKHEETTKLISDLIIVKWDDPQIHIEQKQDTLTPFIIIDFLNAMKRIVKKGLKKSYYKTTQILNGRIKGKLLIKKSMNLHLSKGTILQNVCSFDEFGIDNLENRLLKKALEYIKIYTQTSPLMKGVSSVSEMISYISPAFETVSSSIDVNDIKQLKSNTLYKEYDNGIRLAKMIIRRFAYNISNASATSVPTPPFWIDMPMLFELHVLSLLKDAFNDDAKHHFSTNGNELDFLLNSSDLKMVIDAKYIPSWKWKINHDNVRQVSGYARLKKVSDELGFDTSSNIDCLIIYPDIENGIQTIDKKDFNKTLDPIKVYNGIYKLGVNIPLIE